MSVSLRRSQGGGRRATAESSAGASAPGPGPHSRPEDDGKLVKYVDDNVVGKGSSFQGPYGRRRVVFCDYNGSGRSLQFIEDYILKEVLPSHGGTCSSMSNTSQQTNLFKAEAREVIHTSCNCNSDDVVLLGGSLASLVRALRPRTPVVFVGPAESAATLAPWRECGATIVRITETKEGFLDLNNLELKLQQFSGCGRRLIGCFAAASRVTGILADDVATTLLLHQYGGLAIWGCSLSAASRGLDMNPPLPGLEEGGAAARKDAAYFTCAKYVGGVQAPSVLIAKKALFKQSTLFSSDEVQDIIMKEEDCGSVEAVRAALVVQLKESIGIHTIETRQDRITRQVLSHIRNLPELIILGNDVTSVRKLPIFSLLVKHPRGTFLHHNFVCAVLNDVFGIQARGGLKSTTNYGQELLGIDENLAKEYAKLLGDDIHTQYDQRTTSITTQFSSSNIYEHLRPGFFRISLPYFVSESELAFILEALKMVATEAWKILPHYTVNPETGVWTHHSYPPMRERKLIKNIKYVDGKMTVHERKISTCGTFPQTYFECLQTARNIFSRARKSAQKCPLTEQNIKFNARADYLRWYMLPKEAHDLLLGNSSNVKHITPFDPTMYLSGRKSVSSISSGHSSPILCGSPRHYSLSAIDANQFSLFNASHKALSRESSLQEHVVKPQIEKIAKAQSVPVKFIVGDMVSSSACYNAPVSNLIRAEFRMARSRCHSLGSDSPPPLNPQNIIVPTSDKLGTCNCGSQTDLQSLDDLNNSPSSSFTFSRNNSTHMDCSHLGRASPAVSIASQNSEDLQAYVKEMTKEIATEIKSEIREVISKVEDVLENTEHVDISNINFNNSCANPLNNSVSVSDVAEYLMGVSREMASEVKHEIREMVNQVDEMMSPDINGTGYLSSSSPGVSRKSSPPEVIRRRYRSGSEASFSHLKLLQNDYSKDKKSLRKSPTSPSFQISDKSSPVNQDNENLVFFRGQQRSASQPSTSNKSPQLTPDTLSHDVSCSGNLSFNSSETSSPDTIIQVLNNTIVSKPLIKSLSSHKLSDDENSCTESECQRLCYKNKTWYHNNSVSSQDSGINMYFHDHEGCHDIVKRRPSSDSLCYKKKRNPNRLKSACLSQRQEKSEVPDIIEGVPVCSGEYKSHYNKNVEDKLYPGRVEFEDCSLRKDSRSSCSPESTYSKCACRISNASSTDVEFSRKSSFNTDTYSSKRSSMNTSTDDYARCSDPSCCRNLESATDITTPSNTCRSRLSSNSSTDSEYPGELLLEEDGKWHCPPKTIWKGAVEAIHEFNMIRHQDKILVCMSGGPHSLALLHTLHQYQFYARAKGIHFTIGAITINDSSSNIDPLHLMAYCKTLGIKYIYQDNCDNNPSDNSSSKKSVRDTDLCSFTNHWIRRQIYRSANEHGYNVIATGQHLDDVAQSFIISVFHNGRLRTMKAHYFIREQNLRVIRPFIYVRAKNLIQFIEARHIPSFTTTKYDDSPENSFTNVFDETSDENKTCIMDQEKQVEQDDFEYTSSKVNRSLSAPGDSSDVPKQVEYGIRVRATSAPCGDQHINLLAHQEALQPGLFASLKSALHPLISAKNIDKDMKEHRHRKRSVIQMKNGAPVYNSDEGTDEEPIS